MLKFFSSILFVVTLTSGVSYDLFTCNHFGVIPTDICLPYEGGSSDISYSCNSTDSILIHYYDGGDCGSSDPTSTFNWDISENYNIVSSSCLYSESCDYFGIYEDDNGELSTLSAIFVIQQCYSDYNTSYIVYCDGTEVTFVYYNTNDCSGDYINGITTNYKHVYGNDYYVKYIYYVSKHRPA